MVSVGCGFQSRVPVGVEAVLAELQVSPLHVRKKRERSGRDDNSITNTKTALAEEDA